MLENARHDLAQAEGHLEDLREFEAERKAEEQHAARELSAARKQEQAEAKNSDKCVPPRRPAAALWPPACCMSLLRPEARLTAPLLPQTPPGNVLRRPPANVLRLQARQGPRPGRQDGRRSSIEGLSTTPQYAAL